MQLNDLNVLAAFLAVAEERRQSAQAGAVAGETDTWSISRIY
jgi:hypothetical protein